MLVYKINTAMTVAAIKMIYQATAFDKDLTVPRLATMLAHIPLTVSAWQGKQLIGFARYLTDFEYSAYLSDLAVFPAYQRQGIGRHLLKIGHDYLGCRVTIALRAAPTAKTYYPQVGFTACDHLFRLPRAIQLPVNKLPSITVTAQTKISGQQLAQIFQAAGLRRPVHDLGRLQRMLNNATFIYTAWQGTELVGIARGFTDGAYVGYIADLAVAKSFQRHGIGRQLLAQIRRDLGPQISLLLLAASEAMTYYPQLSFQQDANGFTQLRQW